MPEELLPSCLCCTHKLGKLTSQLTYPCPAPKLQSHRGKARVMDFCITLNGERVLVIYRGKPVILYVGGYSLNNLNWELSDSTFYETFFGHQHVPSIRKAYNLAGAMKSPYSALLLESATVFEMYSCDGFSTTICARTSQSSCAPSCLYGQKAPHNHLLETV